MITKKRSGEADEEGEEGKEEQTLNTGESVESNVQRSQRMTLGKFCDNKGLAI